jgi:hypothetical protein
MSELTSARLKELLTYWPDVGLFLWRTTRGRAASGSVAGSIHRYGYRVINVDGKSYGAHRLVWLYVHGEWPNVIDHINGDRADNRIANLRDVDTRTNAENRKGARTGKSIPLMGVRKATIGKQFTAAIKVNGRVVWLGGYETPELAHNAYLEAKKVHHVGSIAHKSGDIA